MATKFNYGKTFLLGFGFLGISIIWPIFNQYIPFSCRRATANSRDNFSQKDVPSRISLVLVWLRASRFFHDLGQHP